MSRCAHFALISRTLFLCALFGSLLGTAHASVNTLTVIVGANGTGSQDANLTADGIINPGDAGAGAETLSTGALQAVAAGTNISITVSTSITFNDLGGTLTLSQGLGRTVSFQANSGAIVFNNVANTLATSGASLSFTAGTNLTLANLSSANVGDVTLAAGTAAAGNLSVQSIAADSSGNILLQATNGAGGTITQTGVASGATFNATATGAITVDSPRAPTVSLTSNTASVSSLGANFIQASSQLTIMSATGITVNTLANGFAATNTTSGNISVTQGAAPAQPLTINGTGVTSSSAGGTITIENLGSSIAINGGVNVAGNNGAITLGALDLQVNGTVNSGTARTTLANSVAGRQIDLGTNTAGKIGLIQSELNNVTAAVLQIGTPTAGNINVTAAITNPGTWNTLALVNGDTITEGAAGSLTAPNIRVSSVGPVTLNSSNNVGTLAASTTNAFSFSNGVNSLTVGVVDGTTGIATNNSAVTLIADNQNISQTVNAGTGIVTFQPFTNTQIINVGGSDAPGTLGISDAEMGRVTASVLRIGSNSNTGGITISSAITRHPGFSSLDLITNNSGAAVTQIASLSVANLAVQSNGTVTLTNAGNDVDALAGNVSGSPADFFYTDTNGFAVSTVDSVAGISVSNLSASNHITLTTGGSVSEGAGANITGPNLQLVGAGPFALTNSGNNVVTIAGGVTGSLSYTDADALTVGSVNGTNGVTTNGADINITASAITSGTTLTVSQPINTTSTANIRLNADRMSLGAAVNAHLGVVTLVPTSNGRAIDLGTNANVAHLGLLQADLNNVTAGVLRVGDLGTAGNITVTAAITDLGTGWTTLSLLSSLGAGISQNAAATLTVVNLNASGAAGVALNQNNVVSKLAGASDTSAFSFTDSTNLTVDNVDTGLGFGFGSGIIDQSQPVNLTVNVLNGSLGVNQTIDTTHSFGGPANGSNISLIADNITVLAQLKAGTGTASFNSENPLRQITLGTKPGGTLGLIQADLLQVTAALVRVGDLTSLGGILVTAPIIAPGTWNSLELRNQGPFQGGGGILQVPTLSFTDGFPAGHTFNLNNATSGPNAFEEVPNAPIPYAGTTNLTINGGAGNDTFLVTPSGTTIFHINGNAPVTTPGDTLNVDTTGVTGTLLTRSNPGGQSHDGNYTFTNRQTVFFTSIETLSPITNPTASNGTVSGFILDQDGHPVEGVGIWMSGTQNRLTVTDANGFYHFENVEENGLYNLTPARLNYNFSPQTRQFSQLGQHTDAAFTAVYNGETNNPLDRTEYFVRQQYVDLLGREPDEAGFTNWVNGINNCAPDDASCDRIHVAEMFFRSPEFQDRGYYLYRFYSTALGRKPDYAEFTPDMTRVSGFLTDEQLEAAKAKFADDFTTRPLFVSAYGGLSNSDYVDALMRSAQVSLANRDDLIISLNSGTLTRGQVLRQIVESNDVYTKYYNQAFVVMEYFGYLHRDPDDLYLNWIDVLNQTGDPRHMIEGFVDSIEYRQRFQR